MERNHVFDEFALSNRQNALTINSYSVDEPEDLGIDDSSGDWEVGDIWDPVFGNYPDMTNRFSVPQGLTEVGSVLTSTDLLLGIDFLTLFIRPLDFIEEAIWEWDRTSSPNDGTQVVVRKTKRIISTGHTVDLFHCHWEDTGQMFLVAAFNPSEGGSLVDLESALEISSAVYADIGELVVLEEPLETVRLGRVDVTADIAPIANMSALSKAIASATPKVRWGKNDFQGSGSRGGRTVEHWTKTQGKIMFYDKSAEAGISVPTARFEARIEKQARKKRGLVYVADLTAKNIREAFDFYIQPFLYPLATSVGLVATVEGFGPRITTEAIGALWCEEMGIPIQVNANRKVKHRQVIRSLGIVTTQDLIRI
jgi:hypothetical protein